MINFPFGALQTIVIGATGAQAVTVKNNFTYIDGVTTQATGDRTLNVTIDPEVQKGALVLVASKSAATQKMTFGDGITGPESTGVAGKTKTQLFVFTGVAFVAAGAEVQLD